MNKEPKSNTDNNEWDGFNADFGMTPNVGPYADISELIRMDMKQQKVRFPDDKDIE
jgi:hypothetical protein